MILSISATGFQSHVDTHLELCAGLNVITGATDSGKSAILRAIKWVALGEPSGDSFVNKAVGYAEVTIVTDEATITKLRKGTKTSYSISRGLETFVYEKAEVPDEVKQLLGIDKSTFGDFANVLNFAYQLDAPFLLSESPSAGAKVLGKLANAEIVDLAMKEASKSTHALQATQKQYKIEQVEKITALQNYLHLDTVKQLLDECEEMMKVVELNGAKQAELRNAADVHATSKERIESYEQAILSFAGVRQAQQYMATAKRGAVNISLLTSLLQQYRKQAVIITDQRSLLGELKCIKEAAEMLKRQRDSATLKQNLKKLAVTYSIRKDQEAEAKNSLDTALDLLRVKPALLRLTEAESHRSELQIVLNEHGRLLSLSDEYSATLDKALIQIQAKAKLVACKERQELLQHFYKINSLYSDTENFVTVSKRRNDAAAASFTEAATKLADLWKETDICPMCKQVVKGDSHGHSK